MGATSSTQIQRLNRDIIYAIENECDIDSDCNAKISNVEIEFNDAKECTTSVMNICLEDSESNQEVILKVIQNALSKTEFQFHSMVTLTVMTNRNLSSFCKATFRLSVSSQRRGNQE